MKKNILIILLNVFIVSTQFTYAQVAEWIKTEEAGLGISQCVDQFNNLFTLGQYVGTVQIGSETFTSAGIQDFAVVKYDPSGTIQWAVSIGGPNGDFSKKIVYDGQGGIWICGQFLGSLTVGTFTLNAVGGRDGFLIKLNASNGQVVYAQNIGSATEDDALALATDQAGSIYVAGTYQSTISMGGVPLVGQGSYDTFLYKLDTNGGVIWGTSIVGTGIETMWSMTVDGAGNSYIAGHHSSATTTFGGTPQTIPSPSKYVVKFNPNGQFLWVATGTYNGEIDGICTDAAQNVYYTGNFDTQAQIGSTILTGNGLDDILIGKIGSDGTHLWATSFGGTGNEGGRDIACNAAGDVYVLSNVNTTFDFGGFPINPGASTKITVSKLNTSGDVEWVLQSQGSTYQSAGRILHTNTEEVYACGFGTGTMSMAGQGTNLAGTFVVKLMGNANNIQGTVFNDLNEDGVYDLSENGIQNVIVELNNQFYVSPTNTAGLFNLYSGPGAQTVSIPNPPLYHTFSTPSTQNLNFVGMGNTSLANDFGLIATPNMNDLSVDIVGISNPKKGYVLSYMITYKNLGTTAQNATLNLNFPGVINFLSSAPAYSGFTGNELVWNLGMLDPQEIGTITVHFYIPTSLNVGDILASSVGISPTMNDQTPNNNTAAISQAIVGPYDPNYKAVNYDTLYDVSAPDWLEYTVHFQNVGTDTAYNVVIIDTLSTYLNPGFLEIISHSHPDLSLQLRDGNVAEFRFNQILLPDSLTDPIGSQGFVKFRIKYSGSLPLFTSIENFVDIYFDYEAAVRTDTARTYHTTSELNVQELGGVEVLTVFPNPAADEVFILLPNADMVGADLQIYALDGTLVLQQLIITSQNNTVSLPIDISHLRSGVYLVELVKGESLYRTKLMSAK